MKPAKRGRLARPVRVSVSFRRSDYVEVEAMAVQKRVSIAWVIREAVSTYIAERGGVLRPAERNQART